LSWADAVKGFTDVDSTKTTNPIEANAVIYKAGLGKFTELLKVAMASAAKDDAVPITKAPVLEKKTQPVVTVGWKHRCGHNNQC